MSDAPGYRGAALWARPAAIYRAVVTVSNLADTVLSPATVPGFGSRVFLSFQVQGAASAVRFARAATTTNGADGLILEAAGATPGAGGYMEDTSGYTGVCSLRALTAPVSVLIEVL